ncbi:23S rRNA (guanosine(2251)-2'-O)-methyltransferase RlmB [soil metagenome]
MSGGERLICGLQPVREAIAAHGNDLRVVVEDRDVPQLAALIRFAEGRGATVSRATRDELDRWSRGARHQGALAFAPELRVLSLAEVEAGPDALFVILDEIEDPQNFGAIVRSAVAFGATAIVFPEHHAAPLTSATFRASAGAFEHARLCRAKSITGALFDLGARGVRRIGLDVTGPVALADVSLTGPVALVLGAEGKGLRKPVKAECDELARLPMTRTLGSLNVSAAGAVALYEVVRQRGGVTPETPE